MENKEENEVSPKKSKVELFIILILGLSFALIWIFAHWNLSRQPPHHKGPGSVGYEEPTIPPKHLKD